MRWTTLSILAWIGVFLLLVEVPLEIRAKQRNHDTILFGSQVSAEASAPGDSTPYGPTEAFPFRSVVHPQARTPGVPRIWIASASYALGSNVAAAETFPVVLEGMLRAEGLPCEVLNAGRAAYTIRHNIDDLRELAPAWAPDVVLLYQMSTDVDDITRRLLAPDIAAEVDKEVEAEFSGKEPWLNPRRWLQKTTVFPNLKGHISSRLTKARVLTDTLGPRGAQLFIDRNIAPFVEQVRSMGAAPVLTSFAVSHERDTPGEIPLHVFRFNIRLSSEGWFDTLERWDATLAAYAAGAGVEVAPVRAAISGQPDQFVDFVHFTVEGHRKVAAALLPIIRAHVQRLRGDGAR